MILLQVIAYHSLLYHNIAYNILEELKIGYAEIVTG